MFEGLQSKIFLLKIYVTGISHLIIHGASFHDSPWSTEDKHIPHTDLDLGSRKRCLAAVSCTLNGVGEFLFVM